MKCCNQNFLGLLLFLIIHIISADDFYELLGVNRQATTQEIRKAFKKIALVKHPDKNVDDPTAHDNFLRINRAYEVLKDDDLRKKYDMHGEAGLENDGRGQQYRSWNFYHQDFGIYDDDPEVITLSTSDFEQSVQNTEDVWFINYYSPHCSHCHEIAPHWRELAQQLEGVVRIGAVNCEDDWVLCRQQGIRSYPSLIVYPQREKYHGDRTTKALLKHILKHVKAPVIELWSGNFEPEMNADEKTNNPWLITFCGDGGDCLTRETCTKLAAMLVDLVNVGLVDCHTDAKLCKKLGIQSGTYFYQAGEVQKGKGLEITSLYPKDVAFAVLQQLPDVTELDSETFKTALERLKSRQDTAWLIHFVISSSHDLELRKLPALLATMNVGRVDCRQLRDECRDLHLSKYPKFVVFKPGGGHEMHHGRLTAHDVAAFARDSAVTPVRVLGPDDFPEPVIQGNQPWFVDFFAPWCPPCMRLLPEFRKASKLLANQISFGTVDCTVHINLCHQYNIRSYPTTILYNKTVPHKFQGHHQASHIVEFIQDTLRPPVMILDANSFDRLIGRKSEDELWLVDFYAPWCGPCQQLAPEWRRLAKSLSDVDAVKVAQVDCQAHKGLCQQQNVRSYPTIRLYPTGTKNAQTYHMYNGWFRDAQNIKAWAFEYMPSAADELNYHSFHEDLLKGSDPWIVDFFTPWCGHCQVFAPEFEKIAKAVAGRVRAGKVNCDEQPDVCRKAGVRAYPTVLFYAGSRNGRQQSISGEEIDSQNSNSIINYLNRKVPRSKHKKDEL